jgi:hypothetical protein
MFCFYLTGFVLTGLEPMGLFWSMTPEPGQKRFLRMLQKNASSPRVTTLSVYPGHLTCDDLPSPDHVPLAVKDIPRWYMARGVTRIEVREGALRGTLFLPEGVCVYL